MENIAGKWNKAVRSAYQNFNGFCVQFTLVAQLVDNEKYAWGKIFGVISKVPKFRKSSKMPILISFWCFENATWKLKCLMDRVRKFISQANLKVISLESQSTNWATTVKNGIGCKKMVDFWKKLHVGKSHIFWFQGGISPPPSTIYVNMNLNGGGQPIGILYKILQWSWKTSWEIRIFRFLSQAKIHCEVFSRTL